MTKQIIIERTIKIINLLPEDKVLEISDFGDFVSNPTHFMAGADGCFTYC